MIQHSEHCDCDTCEGHSKPDPRALKGEIVFGGWTCMCNCHRVTGLARLEFIDEKKRWKEMQKEFSPTQLDEMASGEGLG